MHYVISDIHNDNKLYFEHDKYKVEIKELKENNLKFRKI